MHNQYDIFENRYITDSSTILDSFYKPAIKNSTRYKRLSGYFSSRIIDQLYDEFIQSSLSNNFKARIICSPELSNEDRIQILRGYSYRKLAEEYLISFWKDNQKSEKLSRLSKLIIEGIIDFKFVVTEEGTGVFHVKEGIFENDNGWRVGFTGSANETMAAMSNNFETLHVFMNNSETDSKKIELMDELFNTIWFDEHPKLLSYDISEPLQKEIEKIANNTSNVTISDGPLRIADIYSLYPYQKEAIFNWLNNDYLGLLEMATGTGKTITALGCLDKLEEVTPDVPVVIVVPQLDLVSQWSEEISSLNRKVIRCSSHESDWVEKLKLYLANKNAKKKVILTTSQTFISEKFQSTLEHYLNRDALLIADEVHSFGAEQTRKLFDKLTLLFKFRLGISATPYRREENESKDLIALFDQIVFKYSLKDAIENNFLNDYNYHPIVLSFTDEELHRFREEVNENMTKKNKLDARGIKQIENVTSTIINSSSGKVNHLKKIISDTGIDNPKIVYCSPGKYNDGTEVKDDRHINYVARELSDLGCRLRKVSSEVSIESRDEILKQFKENDIDTLLAIKCLDQGVNIRNVTHAFIISSTDSLTEFVQRRGRILRKNEGKSTSEIFDLIMLPQDIDDPTIDPTIEDAYLVSRELRRLKEYNQASNNYDTNLFEINRIEKIYEGVLEEYENRR